VKHAIALFAVPLAAACCAQAQGAIPDRHNPLTADLLYFLPQSVIGSDSAARSKRPIAIRDLHRDRVRLNRSSLMNRPAPRGDFSARGAKFAYFPHYSRRSAVGLVSQRKPLLAPRPVNYSPLMDPFYEETAIREAVVEALGYYP
jgi:hypothetical protein